MRVLLMLLAAVAGSAVSAGCFAADVVRVEANDRQALQDRLIALAEERLALAGLFLDRDRAWMSAPDLPLATNAMEVRPLWRADTRAPRVPLAFELRPASTANVGDSRADVARVTLAVHLSRDVLVAVRRLRKGSVVTCADMGVQRRGILRLPESVLTSCEIASQTVALRDLPAGAVVRGTDIGPARAVIQGSPVRVNVAASGVLVTTSAVALADANVGDRIDVRLQRPLRTLPARVVAPGAVQLVEGAP